MSAYSRARAAFVLTLLLAATACGTSDDDHALPRPTPSASDEAPPPAAGGAVQPGGSRYTKVLVIAEENKEYGRIIGSADAPYVNALAARYGLARNMGAGYAVKCPSLAAYILMTSGKTHGICDDKDALAYRLPGDNLFAQVAAKGLQWRGYAESMPGPCRATNTSNGVYLVRHAPAPYYLTEAARCPLWDVPLGSLTGGRLHDDVLAGKLPAYSFVTPNACNDMHGAGSCKTDLVRIGDTWLSKWIPLLMSGPDYRAGRLLIVITWDEGNETDNHIPALVISPTTSKVAATTAFTHCSLLRTIEELLGLPLLNCAKTAASMRPNFGL
jgi:hypothetical protein